jgi:hypothetical protein
MHHYRCQNVYIAATATERIVDTLEFFPQNYQMPQLSSKDRLIMAANDMSNALENPHHEVPFSHIGDDTIAALTKLAEFFKHKFQKVQTQGLPNAPAKASEHTIPANLSHPIVASPVHQQCQTRSQTIIDAKDTTNAPLVPRVVTPMTSRPAPPCRCAHKIFLPEIYHKTTFGTWKLPTWLSPWEITIGHSKITPMQSFTQSSLKKNCARSITLRNYDKEASGRLFTHSITLSAAGSVIRSWAESNHEPKMGDKRRAYAPNHERL